MGENKHINELDAFAKKYIKEIPKSKVSDNFTNVLMDKLVAESKKSVVKTSPLISKKIWFIVLIAFVGLVVFPFKTHDESLLNLPNFEFSFLEKIQLTNMLDAFSVSSVTFYAFLFFGLMICIQIGFLKNYFDKRIS